MTCHSLIEFDFSWSTTFTNRFFFFCNVHLTLFNQHFVVVHWIKRSLLYFYFKIKLLDFVQFDIYYHRKVKMSERPILYYNIASPPCRAVLLVAAELGIELDLKNIDLLGLEQVGEEYVSVCTNRLLKKTQIYWQ